MNHVCVVEYDGRQWSDHLEKNIFQWDHFSCTINMGPRYNIWRVSYERIVWPRYRIDGYKSSNTENVVRGSNTWDNLGIDFGGRKYSNRYIIKLGYIANGYITKVLTLFVILFNHFFFSSIILHGHSLINLWILHSNSIKPIVVECHDKVDCSGVLGGIF